MTMSVRQPKPLPFLEPAPMWGRASLSPGSAGSYLEKVCGSRHSRRKTWRLNSFVTLDGGEIGRAQALQAQACGIEPTVDMNPILLKPESDSRSQVVVRGKVYEALDALAYFERKETLFNIVRECYARLAGEYECIVIEGAGSAAEINLRDRDIVNWPVVELADASVVLVADIDRGGVFAQIIGTLDLLAPHERQRVRGVIVNKFRGDRRLFEDGVRILEIAHRPSGSGSRSLSAGPSVGSRG